MMDLKLGQTFNMGSWGGAPIKWRVLDVQDERVLAISMCAIDSLAFCGDLKRGNAWETSDLKAWLEGAFLAGAFSPTERERIERPTCLSVDEAQRLFAGNADRICFPTAHAVERGVFKAGEFRGDPEFGCYWWLRTPDTDPIFPRAVIVLDDGKIGSGHMINDPWLGARPALWLRH